MRGSVTTRLFPIAAALVVGCGVDDDLGPERLSFALPWPPYTITTVSPRWRPPPPPGVPDVVCRGPAARVVDCCRPPAPAPAIDCAQYPLACDEADGFCALVFDYEEATVLDLADQVEALGRVRNRALTGVVLASVEAQVDGQQLPLRRMDLYVAPADALSAAAPGAAYLATIAAKPGVAVVDLAEQSRMAFAAFAADFRTPFALVLSALVVQKSGISPQGTLKVTLSGTVSARF